MRQADPSVKVEHVVAEDLLAEAQRVLTDDPALTKRVHEAMAGAASNGASLVVCTCSTIGGAAERTPAGGGFAAARIDRAMADRAVEQGPRILLVAALESTLEPTAKLIQESAQAMQRTVHLEPLLVPGAWAHFQRGNRALYVDAIATSARAAAGGADVVVLAQASMAPAADLLADLEADVLTSPTLGVQRILASFQTAS